MPVGEEKGNVVYCIDPGNPNCMSLRYIVVPLVGFHFLTVLPLSPVLLAPVLILSPV